MYYSLSNDFKVKINFSINLRELNCELQSSFTCSSTWEWLSLLYFCLQSMWEKKNCEIDVIFLFILKRQQHFSLIALDISKTKESHVSVPEAEFTSYSRELLTKFWTQKMVYSNLCCIFWAGAVYKWNAPALLTFCVCCPAELYIP